MAYYDVYQSEELSDGTVLPEVSGDPWFTGDQGYPVWDSLQNDFTIICEVLLLTHYIIEDNPSIARPKFFFLTKDKDLLKLYPKMKSVLLSLVSEDTLNAISLIGSYTAPPPKNYKVAPSLPMDINS
eukprot:TRINITY_DN4608_c0_g1_i2.p1 TRINITY_DN4608_c0_g1~~TRINITY_DN4608_c0_g1_i2.p1  ORF type:complete len:127 (-),score=18.84 TRINITY_DN4608_c0_g1_i2:26-406(-)